jgi:hypothetical protein
MPISPSDRAFLKQLYANLADEALKPDSPFYEPVYQELGLDDPVQQISTLIEFDGVESIRLFSGFQGSGKTTELLRLQRLLEERGYFVLYADALNYVNAAEPIEITDLLMVMAGAFSDALEDKLDRDIARETFWERIWTFLNSEINIKEASAKIGYETPAKELFGSVKTGLDLKFELKSATNFRRQLQGFLANKLKELKDNVDRFFEDGIKQIRKARGENTQVVFIFDQLEQLRGTLQTEQGRNPERRTHLCHSRRSSEDSICPRGLYRAAVVEVRTAGNGSDHAAVHRPFVEQRYRPHPLRPRVEGFPFFGGTQGRQGRPAASFWKATGRPRACGRCDRGVRRTFPGSVAVAAGHSGAGNLFAKSSHSRYGNCTHNQRRASRFFTDSAGRCPLACGNCQGACHGATQHRGHSSEQTGEIPR